MTLLLGPIVWGSRNWFTYKGTSLSNNSSLGNTMINSAVLYALAFNIIFFIQELFLVLGKKALGLEALLYHNNHNWVGEHQMTSLMQGSGALAIFLTGLICLAVFHFIRNSRSIWKLLILWLAFHGLVQSIPQVMIASLKPETDVGEALVGYLKLSESTLIILAAICMVSVALICSWFSKLLLEFNAEEVDFSNPKDKFRYIRHIAVGAAVIGSIFVIPFRIFPWSQAMTPFIVFVFSIPWTWSAAAVSKPVRRNMSKVNEKIYWSPIVCLVLLLIFFRLVLAPGVTF